MKPSMHSPAAGHVESGPVFALGRTSAAVRTVVLFCPYGRFRTRCRREEPDAHVRTTVVPVSKVLRFRTDEHSKPQQLRQGKLQPDCGGCRSKSGATNVPPPPRLSRRRAPRDSVRRLGSPPPVRPCWPRKHQVLPGGSRVLGPRGAAGGGSERDDRGLSATRHQGGLPLAPD